MLRALVLVLLLANAGLWAWSRSAAGRAAETPRPAPLHAEALRLHALAEDAPAAAPARRAEPEPAPAPAVAAACLQAGPFDEQQASALRSAVAGLPAGSWRLDGTVLSGRWMVYIGKLADADAVRAKRAELRELGMDTDRPGAAFEPGISLGRYSTEEAAQRALGELGRKGVRTAHVVAERRDSASYQLRLPQADAALRAQVLALGPALAGRPLHPCE
ncbi:MAG: SPOR domain-containing protein [Burkholderiales bacterium]|nr:SPOR domain-containing protein [Burkholderiales bacterium]